MRRVVAGVGRAASGIGLVFGLVAGLVGVGQWVLTARDLAEREAAFQAIHRQFPSFGDGTNVVRGNEWYWVGTATVAGVAILGLCLFAAFLAACVQRRPRDGVVAAWVAATVAAATYVAATIVAVGTSPEPFITKSMLPCAMPLGLVALCLGLLLVPLGARLGTRAGTFFSRRRQAL